MSDDSGMISETLKEDPEVDSIQSESASVSTKNLPSQSREVGTQVAGTMVRMDFPHSSAQLFMLVQECCMRFSLSNLC